MQFKEWLLNESDQIRFTMFSSDGKVRVVIGNKKYHYEMDSIFIGEIKHVSKHKPFTALNMIKKLVKNNKATFEEIPNN